MKLLEMNQLAKKCTEEYHVENETQIENSENGNVEEHFLWMNSNNNNNKKNIRQPLLGLKSLNKVGSKYQSKSKSNQPIYSEPLKGCKCSACSEAVGVEDDIIQTTDLSQNECRFHVNKHLSVQINDHVVIEGNRTGYIRYIGHMDKIGQPNLLFAGIELDAPVGRHDGFVNGKRYFYCEKDYGLFISLDFIVCKVSQKDEDGIHKEKDSCIPKINEENENR
ncbi:hypothetical protein KUTeg_002695 [Tegillarca granosa]|uniref:CAP-Gly domain-containing protein n=1 Tax=Tegillarca granosa TaxID=220873 RepID=A0ABQ9FV24_TEGGR|nr:hypothetical protein KUTeg_002695 [Tegillarca granosa]